MQRTLVVVVLALSLFVLGAFASSHSEAPNTADSPVSDWTDLYAFRSYETGREDFITILANLYGLQAPYGGPNYYTISDQFFYEIYIDNSGDCVEDFTFRFTFGASMGGEDVEKQVEPSDRDCNSTTSTLQTIPGGLALEIDGVNVTVALKALGSISATNQDALNWFEYYSIDLILGSRDNAPTTRLTHNGEGDNEVFVKPYDNVGTKTIPDYDAYANEYIYELNLECDDDGKVFVGQRSDPFYITLGKIFDLLNMVPIPGFPGAIENDPINNDLADRNVHTIALELPFDCFFDGEVAGIWLGTRRLFHDGEDHVPGAQVSRLGNPLVNELVIGLPDKSKFSHSHPVDDAQFGTYVTNPTLPAIISSVYLDAVNEVLDQNFDTLAPTNFPRADLVAAFLTGIATVNQVSDDPAVCEYLRLNTTFAPKVRGDQVNTGVIGGDFAGFPNGRRPGDDLVDIALRVVMGKICHMGLGFCTEEDAVVGNVEFIDGSPVSANDFGTVFPYLNTPIPGATDDVPDLCPEDDDGDGDGAANVLSATLMEAVYELF